MEVDRHDLLLPFSHKCVISFENICTQTQTELSPFPPSSSKTRPWPICEIYEPEQQTPRLDPVSTLPSGIQSMSKTRNRKGFINTLNREEAFWWREIVNLFNKSRGRLHLWWKFNLNLIIEVQLFELIGKIFTLGMLCLL